MKRTPLKRRSPLRRQSNTPKAKLKRKAFELAKRFVRERDKVCQAQGADGEACGGILNASHIYPEGKYRSMRYDVDNMIGMCYKHHLHWWHKNPIEADNWVLGYLGREKYNELRKRSNILRVISDDELREIITKYS